MFSIFWATLLSIGLYAQTTNEGTLAIQIDNLKTVDGVIILALFNNEGDFLKNDFAQATVTPNKNGVTLATFNNLPVGDYAVSIIHDKNENGQLDKNVIGIPTEGFGFSNDKMGTFGPPSFKECLIKVTTQPTEITITLKHF